MKMNYSLLLGMLVAASATAQNSGSVPATPPVNAAPAAPAMIVDPAPAAAGTNAPAKKAPVKHKHKGTAAKTEPRKVAAAKSEKAPLKKLVFSENTITLMPGPAEVCVSNLNVRGQAGLKGEVVAHVQKGETVTVLGQINLDKHKADEPAQWAKISLPAGVDVWVHTSFIDAKDKTVIPKKLNLRGGPSEDYSVVGVIERGTVVTETGTKGAWTKIVAPTNAYGFIAAMYLKQEASGNVPTNFGPSTEVPLPTAEPSNTVPTTVTTVAEPPIANPPAQPAPATTGLLPPPIANDTNTPASAPENSTNVTPTVALPEIDTNLPPVPRVVTHEGYVRSSTSVVAPTYYELYDPTTQQSINYLYSPTTNLDLSHYVGRHINVTGEEGLDSRWKDTPVLTIQKIYVLSTNVLKVKALKSPRASDIH